MTVKERYCSHEVSKLLQEKGFDIWCDTYYTSSGTFKYDLYHSKDSTIDCYAPTQQMACDWIFERYGISIEPMWCCYVKGQPWDCSISSPSIGTKWIGNALCKEYKSQEEAINDSILYVLNNYKPKEQEQDEMS